MFKKVQIMLIIISAVCLTLSAAEKYAILIAGDYTAEGIAVEQQWNEGLGDNTEFWNDLYLQWEMLYKKDYKPENIKVLFAHGTDLWKVDGHTDHATRYRAENVTNNIGELIVDYPAEAGVNGLEAAISSLEITSDDFLYVWVMSHGGTSIQSGLYFNDGFMTDTEFAGLFNTVTANKKVFVINANYAQGFLDKFTGENVRVEVSSQDTKSHRADDETKEGAYIPFLENEEINGEIYYHGEFSFHKYASTMMQTQYGSTSYNSINLQTVDTNNDNLTSIGESYTWASVNISNIEVSGVVDSGEDVGPVFTVGYYSSLDYPTHIYNTFSNGWEIPAFYPTKKGLMAVVENLTITNEYFNINLVLERNSETTILGNNTIEAIEGIYYASVSLGIGSVLQGENNNLIKFTGGSFNLYGALVRDVTIENNGGSIFVDNSSEFDNVKTSLHGGSIDFDYPTGIKTGLEELTLKNNSDLFIEWGTIQGSHQYDEPNIINITDGSTFSIGNEANFNRINLNITDFGKFNYSSTCFFQDESEINVTNSGILNFPAGGTYTPTVSITAISGGQVQLGERSTLNMNSANFTIESGSRITLQENSRLNTNYVIPAQTSIYAGNNSSVCGNIDFSEYSTLKLGWDDVHHITAGSVVNFYSESKIWLSQGSELIIDAGAVLNLYGGMTIVYAGGSGITNNG